MGLTTQSAAERDVAIGREPAPHQKRPQRGVASEILSRLRALG